MEILSLNGDWLFKNEKEASFYPAVVPGCNFLDLLNNKLIEDPFYSTNEADLQWVVKENWVYKKTFTVDEKLTSAEKIQLVAQSLDTLADIQINGKAVGSTNNVHRTYIFDIKPFLHIGQNTIQITFNSPVPYIASRQKILLLPHNTMAIDGFPHIRKAASSFGWDFAPKLPQCGILKDIYIRSYSDARLTDLEVHQEHVQGKVTLKVLARAEVLEEEAGFTAKFTLTAPNGETLVQQTAVENSAANTEFLIENPELWWCATLGGQPLYQLVCELSDTNDAVISEKTMRIGLRTIRLDTEKDQYGSNFCFYINGIPIFAKGSNWIPPDMFTPRVTKESLRYKIQAMKNANMNLIRVWGGGYYESDDFYDLCDELGMLVWQDMAFACAAYPLQLVDFTNNVFCEVQDNVRRLRHHACLSLWCGNNEIESMSMAWSYRRRIMKETGEFFYKTMPGWIRQFDSDTDYWACTPSSGEYMKNVNHDDYGDTHLWNVWHGMRDVEYYRTRYTRFCSEFGLESYPTMNCINEAIPKSGQKLKSKELNAHQKCGDGDQKMLYYLEKRFWQPKEFYGLVYLTQITQMECIRDATEHWRRNRNRCHGSLYWQFNDCWSGSSWSGMDYKGNYKALMYGARHFNENVTLSLENKWRSIKLYCVNDTLTDVDGYCEWKLELFNGRVIESGRLELCARQQSSILLREFDFKEILKKYNERDTVFVAVMYDRAGNRISERRAFIYRENECTLPNPQLQTSVTLEDGKAAVSISASKYARFVCMNLDGYFKPFSDNFFDLSANECRSIEIEIPEDWDEETFNKKFSVLSLYDIEPEMTKVQDQLKTSVIALKPINIVNWIGRLFDK